MRAGQEVCSWETTPNIYGHLIKVRGLDVVKLFQRTVSIYRNSNGILILIQSRRNRLPLFHRQPTVVYAEKVVHCNRTVG